MGFFGRYLRARPGRGGGVNEVKDPAQKKKFAKEIEDLVDPDQREAALLKNHENLVLKAFREPSVKEVLSELSRQCKRMREKRPEAKLMACCGAYAFALMAQVRSYPEHSMGLELKMDKRIPPWDTVVIFAHQKGRAEGGIL